MAKVIPRELIKHLEWTPRQRINGRTQLDMVNPWKYAKTRYDVSNSPYFKDDNSIKDTIMSEKHLPINFENAQNVEINVFNYPPVHNSTNDDPKRPDDTSEIKTKYQSIIDTAGKIVSIISGVAVLAFVLLLWTGKTRIGELQIGHMLTVFSFTLFSGLISIGGVKILSLSANLRKANDKIEKYIVGNGGCPFVYIIDDSAKLRYQIESPYKINDKQFCRGCFLVDHNGHTECTVSPLYHRLTSRSS